MARKRSSFFYQLPIVIKYFLLGLSIVFLVIISSEKAKAQIHSGSTLTQMGYEQLHQGYPDTAIKTWSLAYKAYERLNDSEGMTGSLINQSLGFQAQGFYSSACNTLLTALKLSNEICSSPLEQVNQSKDSLIESLQRQPLTKVQVIGLHQMGDILRLIGKPEASFVVLQKALVITSDLKLLQ